MIIFFCFPGANKTILRQNKDNFAQANAFHAAKIKTGHENQYRDRFQTRKFLRNHISSFFGFLPDLLLSFQRKQAPQAQQHQRGRLGYNFIDKSGVIFRAQRVIMG